MLDPAQFREEVVRPALVSIGMHSAAAEALVFCTAIQESRLKWLRQHAGGPALGLFQIEPATFQDIYGRYLERKPAIMERLRALETGEPLTRQLISNLSFATAICRLRYWMDRHPLPAIDDADGMGAYWKRVYNTDLGAGRPQEFAALYREHVL
jgi:hypothetical protein